MAAEWVPGAIFYALNPDRFARGTFPTGTSFDETSFESWDAPPKHKAYKGGNLYGLVDRLDYLQDLGINALYLTPIFTSPAHHRYKTIDYYQVDPLLGGNQAFDVLRKETWRRGMRLVLDGVFNHVGAGFARFQDVLEYGGASPWRNWFHVENWPEYKCWNNNKTMPVLNHSNSHVREYILDVAEYWAKQGIDGWRMDAPQDIRFSGFWQEMRKRLTAINPQIYIVGEIWTSAVPWLDGTQWHGVTNYPLMSAIHRFVAGDRVRKEHLLPGSPAPVTLDASGFRVECEGLLLQYSWEIQLCQLNFLGTHDTARFRSLCGEDEQTVELATAVLMAMPGAPCIYYGDEIGMSGGVPPGSRGGFPDKGSWNQHSLAYHRDLISLRRSFRALQTGRISFVISTGLVLVFDRTDNQNQIRIIINAGSAPANVHINSPLRCLYGYSAVQKDGSLRIPARTAAYWELSP